MSQVYDNFADVVEDEAGIFGGSKGALSKHDGVQTTPTAEGVCFDLGCVACGKKKLFTLPWAEIVSLKYGVVPAAWLPNGSNWGFGSARPGTPAAWRAQVPCQCGEKPTILSVAPVELDSWLNRATESGLVDVNQLRNIAAQVQQIRARGGR